MGEAKRRREMAVPTVYHHTSTLRTNLIWMTGIIELEGRSSGVHHPALGEIKTDALARRQMADFPPLAWFTTEISVPKCLLKAGFYAVDRNTGEQWKLDLGEGTSNAIALNRIAIGFAISDIPVVPWSAHRGYHTAEGAELNETAREAGDDPANWYVSEQPVDVMLATEIWSSKSIMRPRLERLPAYLGRVKEMVQMCRETPGAMIPPTWIDPEVAARWARQRGIAVRMSAPDSGR